MSCVEEKNEQTTALKKKSLSNWRAYPRGWLDKKNPEHDGKTKM